MLRKNKDYLQKFRKLFGDERADYGEALKTCYANGVPVALRKDYISKYATSHPWEDWAETWAHYLHIMDTLETAHSFALSVDPKTKSKNMSSAMNLLDPYGESDFERIVDTCIPIFFAINSINRGMGIPDIYPFLTTKGVLKKMKFIHGSLINFR